MKEGHTKDNCRSHLQCDKCKRRGHLAKNCRINTNSSRNSSRNNSQDRNNKRDRSKERYQRQNNASYETFDSSEEDDELVQDLNDQMHI